MRLAERACQRLVARESIAGTFALPYETALLLARAELDEVDSRLRFIERAEEAERARLVHNLREILRGVSFQDEAAQAVAERILQGNELNNVDSRKVFGSKLDDQQQFAMFITTVILGEIDRRWKRRLRTGQVEELSEIIRNAVYSSLHARASYDRLASSKEFVNAVRVLMPRYYQPAVLIGNLVRSNET